MDPAVGDLARPARQVRLERRPALEPSTGDGVALHVADPALVLALGAGAVGSAGARPEPPVPGERMQLGVEPNLASRRVVMLDQCPGVIQPHPDRDTTEQQESFPPPGQPVAPAFPQPPPATKTADRRGG